MTKQNSKKKTAISSNGVLAERFKNLNKKMEEAISGMYEDGIRATNCTVRVGYIKTSDGRKAQVKVSVEADKDEWI